MCCKATAQAWSCGISSGTIFNSQICQEINDKYVLFKFGLNLTVKVFTKTKHINGQLELADRLHKTLRQYIFSQSLSCLPQVTYPDVYHYLVENEYTREAVKAFHTLDVYNIF